MRGRPEALQGLEVGPGPIPDIALPPITGITGGEAAHDPVTGDLRDDRGTGDRMDLCISTDDRCLTLPKCRDGQPIDEEVVGLDREPPDSSLHRKMCRPQDIQLIDLAWT